MKVMFLRDNIWNSICNGYTNNPPLEQDLYKNKQALNAIFNTLFDLILEKVMHCETIKEVWDNL